MKEILLKVWNWLVKSSTNPEAVSLTVKGFGLGLIPVLLSVSGIAHISLTGDDMSNIVTMLSNLIDIFLTVIAGILSIYGLIRKIVFTVEGK